MASSKYNPIARMQKWMDSMAGQTFMQYAYSWGAAVVILGALFKLIHVNHADIWLIVGMGTEVFVFFVAAFERVTEKVDEPASAAQQTGGVVYGGAPVVVGGVPAAEGDASASDANVPTAEGGVPVAAASVATGEAPAIVGGVVGGAPIIINGGGAPVDPDAIAAGADLSAAAANLAASIKATDPAAVEEAVKNYAEELTDLTEVLGRVKAQAARMSTDSEEMENLNRTLTGIATVYELQLKNISKQVNTIEQIDEQTKRMAHQIEELNNVYARMIQALTVNMNIAPNTATAE